MAHDPMHRYALLLKFIYAMTGLLLGFACIFAGSFLLLNGVTGSTTVTAKFFGVDAKMADAASGVVVVFIGVFFVLVTRFKIKDIKEYRSTKTKNDKNKKDDDKSGGNNSDESGDSESGRVILEYNISPGRNEHLL